MSNDAAQLPDVILPCVATHYARRTQTMVAKLAKLQEQLSASADEETMSLLQESFLNAGECLTYIADTLTSKSSAVGVKVPRKPRAKKTAGDAPTAGGAEE